MSFKVIIDYYKNFSFEQISLLDADYIVVHLKGYSCFAGAKYDIETVKNIADMIRLAGKKPTLGFDAIIEEYQIDESLRILDSIIEKFDGIIYSDLGIYKYLKDRNQNIVYIYDSKTYIASKYENNYWRKKNIIPIIANELNESELSVIAQNGNVALEAFGYHRIMYSKRKLLNMYQDYINDSYQFATNKMYYAKEELRNEMCPIVETEIGTMIYTPYIYNALELLDNECIKSSIDFVKVSTDFLDEEMIMLALNILKNANHGKSISYDIQKLYELGTSRGFLDRQSFLVKGGKNA